MTCKLIHVHYIIQILDERKTNSNFLLGSIGIFPLLSIKEIIPLLFEIITVKTKTKIQSEESFLKFLTISTDRRKNDVKIKETQKFENLCKLKTIPLKI